MQNRVYVMLEHKWRASLIELLNYAYAIKGIQCQSNRSPQLFELIKKQQNQVALFKNFFVIFLIVVVTHNTFTQLNIPTQDLPSWFV